MTHDHREACSRWLALSICAFAYLYVFPYQSKINNPNENVRFYMTAALVEEGRYEIDTMRARWGFVNDAAVRDGKHYSVKAPGTSFLGMPGYALYRELTAITGRPFDRTEALWACRFTASILPTLLWLYALHIWLSRRGHHPALRDAVFFSVALGSLLYIYGTTFVSHTLSAAVSFSSFMLLSDMDAQGPLRTEAAARSALRAFAAGLFAAATTLFEYPGLACSVVLSVYALYVLRRHGGPRNIAAFACGGLLPALVMMHFQWRSFGSPFTPGHLMVEDEGFRHGHEQGFYGAVGPNLSALRGLLIELGPGLFPLTPLLIFAPLGFYVLMRRREHKAQALCALAVSGLTILLISSMEMWRGGWTIGPRYLALVVPFMAWLAFEGLAHMGKRAPMLALACALGTTATGMLASGLPSAYYPHIPPEFTRPLPQLYFLLIAHDYAPPNAGAWLGAYGSASMLPLLLAALAALALCVRSVPGVRPRLALCAASLVIAIVLAAPLLVRPAQEPGVSEALAFVTQHFTPEGHDSAAKLRAQLKSARVVSRHDRELLAAIYEAEGRVHEARRARRGRL
jgi:hypothetical protein